MFEKLKSLSDVKLPVTVFGAQDKRVMGFLKDQWLRKSSELTK